MKIRSEELQAAALRLHSYLTERHADRALRGPDPGIRFNARIGRFIKSYLPFLPWGDQYAYMQAQGYWIKSNWLLSRHAPVARDLAVAASDYVLAAQQQEGHWRYPNPEWRTRIATVEGCFASIGLLESYLQTGHDAYRQAADRWYQYMLGEIGFQRAPSGLAVNYFAHARGGTAVPNNSTLVLYLLAKFYEVTGEDRYLEKALPLISWLQDVQLESGELPYSVASASSDARSRIHFLCYQYNAFEFMDLAEYYRLTGDPTVLRILRPLARYLSSGLTAAGCARYDCRNNTPEVLYYALAIAQSLSQARQLGLGNFDGLVDRAYQHVLVRQRPDGYFAYHSRANYGILSDRRRYPRYLAIMLFHLLLAAGMRPQSVTGNFD